MTKPESTAFGSVPSQPAQAVRLAGGTRMVREAISVLLQQAGLAVCGVYHDEAALAADMAGRDRSDNDVVVLLLSGSGPFQSFQCMKDLMSKVGDLPLVVASDRIASGQVQGALRVGAKGFVSLDADPAELTHAILQAAKGQPYLTADASQLLARDISNGVGRGGRAPARRGVELSHREIEIVQLLCEGQSSKEIGRNLQISPKTVENHRYNIYRKCDVESIAELIRHAINRGLVSI
ncbi:MAG: response regulator transcription factor [Planctomycetaceae bacterium]|nr:response regulator transcription factor [Planctomycetaceae bacterium]